MGLGIGSGIGSAGVGAASCRRDVCQSWTVSSVAPPTPNSAESSLKASIVAGNDTGIGGNEFATAWGATSGGMNSVGSGRGNNASRIAGASAASWPNSSAGSVDVAALSSSTVAVRT
jgi:hypothetical protein